MRPTLKRLLNDFKELTLEEQWQLVTQAMDYIQRRTTGLENGATGRTSLERKVKAREVLLSTQGSWGSKTLDEIDAEIDRQRQEDWGE